MQEFRASKLIEVYPSVGISTGLAYCGVLGNARRREFAVIGNKVNMAARLSQPKLNKGVRGYIMCDEPTKAGTRGNFVWGDPQRQKLKGNKGIFTMFELQNFGKDASTVRFVRPR